MASLKIDESEIKKPDIGYIPTHYRDVMREEGGSATNLPTLKVTEIIPNQGSQTQKSNFEGGIEREVRVYDVDGELIQSYAGKFDVVHDENRILFDDEDGKRHVIYYPTGTIIIDEK